MTPQSREIATGWLVNAGLRPTRQRVALAELLVGDGRHRHVTAESLFESAKANGETRTSRVQMKRCMGKRPPVNRLMSSN